MRTNRLHYLHQKPHQKVKLKSILLTFIAVTLLSACGIKGDLYQTPEQAVAPKAETVAQSDESQEKSISKSVESQEQSVTTLDESQQQQAVQQPIEPIEQATNQSTVQVKEQQ
ncbi:lipoprotein [Colwellia demingiae]|uniref:Lipoprotein n=1 Tax=Colwellia demingiae TaxID=89401 RepID=A0A5C6Q5B5_9GAMM|nr:lipoprotein [Colwellia demingiae]TWX63797.1 lipoprotein [Colwellia demingiae]